jgi:hypothetical protein
VELETVLLKAIAKNPTERYATAQEFADDLQRWLDYRPILARRPTLAERGLKWARRHRPVVIMAGLVVLLALAGFATSTVLIAREQAQTRAALQGEKQRAKEAEEQRGRAQAGFLQARRALDFISRIGNDELAGKPGMQRVRKKLLAAALDYYQKIIEQSKDDPEMRSEVARCHWRAANILGEMHADMEALAELEQARTLQEAIVTDNPNDLRAAARLGFIRLHLFSLQGCPAMALLLRRDVRRDLGLSDDQGKAVKQLKARLAEQRRKLLAERQPAPAEEQRHALIDIAAANSRAIPDLLTAAQCQRLQQIALQAQGFYAFTDPEVDKTLELTAAQKQKIVELQAMAYDALWEYFYATGNPDAAPGAPEQIRQRTRDSILMLLTPDQVARWHELMGTPFAGDIYLGNRRITVVR